MNFYSSDDLIEEENEEDLNLITDTGPIEIEEPFDIIWNSNDWPKYIKCPFSSENNNLMIIIEDGWKLKQPRIILSIISQFDTLRWNDENKINNFQKGLVKAASAAKMWIITNGIDVGASRIVANAIANEKRWFRAQNKQAQIMQTKVIGVVRDDRLTSDPLLQRNLRDIEKLNETDPLHQARNKTKEGQFYIDSNHTHFIFVTKGHETDAEQLLALDLFDELSYEISWVNPAQFENVDQRRTIEFLGTARTPLIALVIQGNIESAEIIFQYILKSLPVVVFQGTGGVADLIAFTYNEITNQIKQEGIWDEEFVKTLLNQTLFRKIVQTFPKLRDNESEAEKLREKIISCVRNSLQDDLEYLTIINVDLTDVDLTMLDKYLLEAYFKTKENIKNNSLLESSKQLTNDLHLTLSWNNPDLASSKIFQRRGKKRVTIAKELFLRALTEPNREEFVEIFLKAHFNVRRIYNFSTIKWLMREAMKNDFFRNICCSEILVISATDAFPSSNEELLLHLNKLIDLTTNLCGFLNPKDLTYKYTVKPSCIEHKAKAFITMWSVFINNMKLTRKLWPFHGQPINLTLMISSMLKTMSTYSNDLSLQMDMLERANEFGGIATQILNEYHINAPNRATHILSLQSPHWNYQTSADVAVKAEVHSFIAHPCCQKWLTNLFYNKIYIKKSQFGEFSVPEGVKIILCTLFVLPIYIWLDFSEHLTETEKNQKINQNKLKFGQFENDKSQLFDASKESIKVPFSKRLSLIDKWFLVIEATVTKFWFHHVAYLIFLVMFTFDVAAPGCGNRILDFIIFYWLLNIFFEDIRRTYLVQKRYLSISINARYIYLPALTIFLWCFYNARILRIEPIYKEEYFITMLMCCALFYSYLRYMDEYIPMSAFFGPMFYRVKLMTVNDFVHFLLLCSPFMIVFGIIIAESHLPDASLTDPVYFKKVFHRTFYSLFRTFDEDLFRGDNCSVTFSGGPFVNSTYCQSSYNRNPKCNNYGFWAYLFNILFLVLLKLVLTSLLFALFSNRLGSLDSDTIWRYLRYQLINEFSTCYVLPPPLSIFCYLYYFLKYISKLIFNYIRKTNTKQTEELQQQQQKNSHETCNGCTDELSSYFARKICQQCVKDTKQNMMSNEARINLLKHNLQQMYNHSNSTTNELKELRRAFAILQTTVGQMRSKMNKNE